MAEEVILNNYHLVDNNIAVNYIWLQSYKIKSVSFKKPPNRLNFNYFKERLVHFNGTVVIFKMKL